MDEKQTKRGPKEESDKILSGWFTKENTSALRFM
jgi:hypothetical protein